MGNVSLLNLQSLCIVGKAYKERKAVEAEWKTREAEWLADPNYQPMQEWLDSEGLEKGPKKLKEKLHKRKAK